MLKKHRRCYVLADLNPAKYGNVNDKLVNRDVGFRFAVSLIGLHALSVVW